MMSRLLRFLLVAVVLFGAAGAARAALSPNSIVTAQTPNRGILQFTSSSSAGTYATLYTAGTNGSICKAIWSDNSDGSATHLISVQVVNAGTKYGGVALTSVSNAGFANATPPQSLFSAATWPGLPLDQNGNPYLILVSGDTLQATFATAITASTQLDLHAVCSDF